MARVATKGPLGLKDKNNKADKDHLRRVRGMPCCICEKFGMAQLSSTAAHHCIHGRYSSRKTPDRMAIPLCEGHRQGNFDKSEIALHRQPNLWREKYGNDTDYIGESE